MGDQPDEARDAYMLAMMEPVQPDFEALPCMRCGESKEAHPFSDALVNCRLWRPARPALYKVIEAQQSTITSLTEQVEGLRTYSKHNDFCPAVTGMGGECECGFEAALGEE